jgi:hypothetical protein
VAGDAEMNGEIVVLDDVHPYTGKRALLIKRAGQPVEISSWIDRVPESVRGKLEFYEYEIEKGMFTWHHLRMNWMTREFIGFEIGDSRLAALAGWEPTVKVNGGEAVPAVGWTLESGERMSSAIRSAAELYWGTIGKWPQVALVKKMPKDAPESMQIDGSDIFLLARDWMWREMVVVL